MKNLKLLTMCGILAVSCTASSYAAMNLSIVYNTSADETTFIGSGSWDVFSKTKDSNTTFIGTASTFVLMAGGTISTMQSVGGGLTKLSGDSLPSSGALNSSTVIGDRWGFGLNEINGPFNYTAGDSISSSLVVSGDVTGLVTSGSLAGTYTGNGNTFTFTGTTVVPETSSYGLLLGLAGTAVVFVRRKRRG